MNLRSSPSAAGLLCLILLLGASLPTPGHAQSWLDKLKNAAQQLEKSNNAAAAKAKSQGKSNPAGNAQTPLPVNAAAAGVKIEKQTLGRPPQGALMTISPAGQHVGWAAFQGSRAVMVVDGVAGPAFDTLLPDPNSALVFSDDGAHYAYLGRDGDSVSFVLDGKVIGHTPYHDGGGYKSLSFGPYGVHVYFIDYGEYHIPLNGQTYGGSAHTVVMDGKPGPVGGGDQGGVAFSPDGQHYAYTATDLPLRRGTYTIYDGKRRDFGGGQLSFGSDGRILNIRGTAGGQELLVGGKVVLKAAAISNAQTSAGGHHILAQVRSGASGSSALWVDGHIVANPCEWLKNVTFSKDGKRYIAVCDVATNGRAFAVVDGHKGREYFAIGTSSSDAPRFTADDSHAIYNAMVQHSGTNVLSFVVVDDKEYGPYGGLVSNLPGPGVIVAKRGASYAFAPVHGYPPHQIVIWNGRELALSDAWLQNSPSLSDNGAHLAFNAASKSVPSDGLLYYDGKLIAAGTQGQLIDVINRLDQHRSLRFALSPDGSHIAYVVEQRAGNQVTLHLDDSALYSGSHLNVVKAVYTPDSRHLFWVSVRGGAQAQTLYMDNKPVLSLPPPGPFDGDSAGDAWRMYPGGSLQFLSAQNDGTVLRYRITPAVASQ